MKNKDQANSWAVVTGATSGIGLHFAKHLALLDYNIVAVSNQSEELKQLHRNLEKETSIKVRTLDLDLSQTDAAKSLHNACKEEDLIVEILINNAGTLIVGEVVNTEDEKASKLLELHMNSPMKLCQLFGRDMVDRRSGGYILNVSSIAAVMPYPTISLYGPSKSFLREFSKAFRMEMKPHNVIVTCLIPGATDTPLLQDNPLHKSIYKSLGITKSPEWVADKGLSAMFSHRAECIPGAFNKLIVFISHLIPNFVIRMIYNKMRS